MSNGCDAFDSGRCIPGAVPPALQPLHLYGSRFGPGMIRSPRSVLIIEREAFMGAKIMARSTTNRGIALVRRALSAGVLAVIGFGTPWYGNVVAAAPDPAITATGTATSSLKRSRERVLSCSLNACAELRSFGGARESVGTAFPDRT